MAPPTRNRDGAMDLDPEKETSQKFRLEGWAGIEQHLMKYDTGKMNDYAEDIDTLLVFAALFSAILTTFVVQTYPLLQQADSTITNQLLAYQISSQSSHTNMPSPINTTLTSLLTTPAFAPPTSARWINVLFFFSLVLSLSAALFGIMAKQWIREYLKWNAALAAPRENVLLRQIRIENWEKWNVEAFIWSIPSLLELAMILFLAGVVILLWTLDKPVAIAVTSLIAFFLIIISVITVIPIFMKHCPYKSPTTWVFLHFWEVASYFQSKSYFWLRKELEVHVQSRHYGSWWARWHRIKFPRDQTWRTKDLSNDPVNASVEELCRKALAEEATHINHRGEFIRDPDADSVSLSTVQYFVDDLRETSVLLRALDWVATASQDEHVTRCLSQCLLTIHVSPPQHEWCDPVNSGALTLLMIAARWPYYLQRSRTRLREMANLSNINFIMKLRRLVRLTDDTSNTQQPQVFRWSSYWPNRGYSPIIARYLTAELQTSVIKPSWVTNDMQLRRVFQIVAIIKDMLSASESGSYPNPDVFKSDADLTGLRAILEDDNGDFTSQLCSRALGLRSLAFCMIIDYAGFKVISGTRLQVVLGPAELSDFEDLLGRYLDIDLQCCSEDDVNIVILAGWQWLSLANLKSNSIHPSAARIIDLVRHALDVSLPARKGQVHNLLICRNGIRSRQPKIPPWAPDAPAGFNTVCRALLHVLQKYQASGYGLCPPAVLHDNLIRAHEQKVCEIPACPWIGHQCPAPRFVWILECPLFKSQPVEDAISPSSIHSAPPPTVGGSYVETHNRGGTAVDSTTRIGSSHSTCRTQRPLDEEDGATSEQSWASAQSGSMPSLPVVESSGHGDEHESLANIQSPSSPALTSVAVHNGTNMIPLDTLSSHPISKASSSLAASQPPASTSIGHNTRSFTSYPPLHRPTRLLRLAPDPPLARTTTFGEGIVGRKLLTWRNPSQPDIQDIV